MSGAIKRTMKALILVSAIGLAAYAVFPKFRLFVENRMLVPLSSVAETISPGSSGKKDISGTYACSAKNFCPLLKDKEPNYVKVKDAGTITIKHKEGNIFTIPIRNDDNTQIIEAQQGFGSSFSYFGWKFDPSGFKSLSISGYLEDKDTLIKKDVADYGKREDIWEFTCKRVKSKSDFVKAVFIRPCEKELFENNAFGTEDHKTKVAGKTIESVCKDLSESGVTDIFIPFKAENTNCGDSGELLYNSLSYGDHENNKFKSAIEKEFDPIETLITTCEKAYSKAGKQIRFHAWFPVFNDKAAAGAAGQKASLKKDFFTSVVDWFSGLFGNKKHDYESKKYADPENDAVVTYELTLLGEIMKKYPSLDGINLDYIRYASVDDMNAEYTLLNSSGEIGNVDVNSGAIEKFVRKVREKFPHVILSADVKAGIGARRNVGQNGILFDLDWIMPMTYATSEVEDYVPQLTASYPSIKVVPDLRGWAENNQSAKEFLLDLKAAIEAAKAGGAEGYGIFTYENLLTDAHAEGLKDIKEKVDY